jgi:HD superfamily phosphohydrolase YqeK
LKERTSKVIAAFFVLALATAVAVFIVYPLVPEDQTRSSIVFGIFSTIGVLLPYALSNGASGNSSMVTVLASVMLAPVWTTVLCQFIAVLLAELWLRRPLRKFVFNASQFVVSLSLAVFAYRATGGVALERGGEASVFPILAAFATLTFINSCAVSLVVAAESGASFGSVWRSNTLSNLVISCLALPFVYVFGKIYIEFGGMATAAAAGFIIIVRQLNSTNEELHRSHREILEITATTLEARDPYTSGHSRRVSEYSRIIGESIPLPTKQLERLHVAAMLHDVGKIHEAFAPILSKPGKLTPEERAVMESHPIKGAELVKISSHLRDTVEPIRHHHEAWDGSGYPDGLAGSAIPLFARIIAIADTIDAMASDRPYRRGLSSEKIRAELVRMRGIQFDPDLLGVLLSSGVIDRILGKACADIICVDAPKLALVANQ